MGRLSERNFRLTPVTIDLVNGFPSWMKLKQPGSVGFGFFNVIGCEFERAQKAIDWIDENLEISTAYQNEVSKVYRSEYDFIIPGITEIFTTAMVGETPTAVPVAITDERTFFYGPATRLSYDGLVVEPSSVNIIGLEYMTDYPASSSGAYWVAFDINNSSGGSGVMIFDKDWNRLETYAYGRETQSYENQGFDEIIYPESSSYLKSLYEDDPNSNPWGSGIYNVTSGTLNRIPITNTVRFFDVLNLDDFGEATEVYSSGNTGEYTSGVLWSVNGPSWTMTNPQSRYVVTYDYLDYEKATFITFNNKKDHISKYVQTMQDKPFTSIVPTGYVGTSVSAEFIESDGVGLRVDPTILRPGNSADIDFTYWNAAQGYWADPTGTTFELTITDPYFISTEEDSIIVGTDANNMEVVTYYTSPTISGNYVSIPASSVFGTDPLYVNIAYEAQVTISSTGVQSYGVDGTNPYPYDYEVVNLDKQYVKPYTVLPLSHPDPYINGALASGMIDSFDVITKREYTGVAFSDESDVMTQGPTRNAIYVFERNNQILIKKRSSDHINIGIWAMFCPDQTASGYVSYVVPSGMTLIKTDQVTDQSNKLHTRYLYRDFNDVYIEKLDTPYFHFLPYEMHTSVSVGSSGELIPGDPTYRDIRGIVFHDGKLYMAASEAYEEIEWPKEIGVYGPASTGNFMCKGQLYVFDCADLSTGTDSVKVELHDQKFELGEEVNDPRDITLDEDENLLIANGSGIYRFNLHYDYATAIQDQSQKKTTVYFREEYITVSNIEEE